MRGCYGGTLGFIGSLLARLPRRAVVAGAAALVLLVGALVVVATRDDEGGTNIVAGSGTTSSTTEAIVTTTTLPVEATTTTLLATTTTTTTTARPKATTTTTARPTTTTARALAASPLEPGTKPWGYGDLGASREVTQGRTRVVWAIYMRDLYKDEPMQTSAEIHDEGLVKAVHVDFGDGTSWDSHGSPSCADFEPTARPRYHQAPWHQYGASGDYRVTVRVTTVSCREWAATGTEVDENVVTVALTAHRFADRCRPSPDCPG